MNRYKFDEFFIMEESEKIKHESSEIIQELDTTDFEIQIIEEEM